MIYTITIKDQTIILSELDYELIPDSLKTILETNNFVKKIK